MKRTIGRRGLLSLGAAAGAASAFGLSSCANGPGGSPEGSFKQADANVPGKYAKRQVIVMWSAWGGIKGEAIQKLADKFNKSQKDIYLDVQFQGSYGDIQQKITASLQNGTAPDMFAVSEGDQGKMEMQEVAAPLNEYIDKETMDRFNDAMIKQWTVNGQVYQVPFARSTPLFYYNRDIYKKAGLPDRGPKTWTEFEEWAKEINKLKTSHGDPMPALTSTDSGWYFQAYVWEWKGKLSEGMDVKVNEGGAVEAAKYFHNFFVKKKLGVPNAGQDTFNNGFVASGIYSTASLSQIEDASKDRIGAAFIPAEKQRLVPNGGSGFTVPIGITRERKQAAGQVLMFLAQADNAAYWTVKSGYVPIVDDAVESPLFKEIVKKNPNYQVAPDQLKYAKGTDGVRSFVPGSGDIIANYAGLLYSSSDSPQSTLDRLAGKLQRACDAVRPEYERLMSD